MPQVSADKPLRLDAAAKIYFGSESESGINGRALAGAIRRGDLVGSKIRGKWFTTVRDLSAWRCRVRSQPTPLYRPPEKNAPPTAADADAATARCEAAIASLRGASLSK